MVARKRTTRRKQNSEAAHTDLLTTAARMVGTALGSISVKVRGRQGETESKPAKVTRRKRKPVANKKAVRKAATKTISRTRKKTGARPKKS